MTSQIPNVQIPIIAFEQQIKTTTIYQKSIALKENIEMNCNLLQALGPPSFLKLSLDLVDNAPCDFPSSAGLLISLKKTSQVV